MSANTDGTLGARAVVVGAGMGGMMAAAVLSRHFAQVLVLDKDTLAQDAQPRFAVPQGAHAHALLVQGRRNLESIFPGLTSALLDAGAVVSRMGTQFRMRDEAGWQTRRDLGMAQITLTRPLLESTVRAFLARNPRVTLRGDAAVEGWRFDGDRVAGVTLQGGETVAADLVIDATGRSGNAQSFLEAGGFGPVEETRLEQGSGYASALFKKPADWRGPMDSLVIFATDPQTRGGFLFSVENDCWIASLIGRFDQQPPGDPDAFMAFAKGLCEPELYDAISRGTRITPVKVYKAPVSRWRHYERLARFAQRVLPVGDAYAHVNPVYGQGMTLASIHVLKLGEILVARAADGGGLDDLAAPYFAAVESVTRTVWQALEVLEWGYAGTKGERPADIDMRMGLTRAIRKLADEDAEVHTLFLQVANLVVPLEAILTRPDIMGRAMALMTAPG